MKKAKYFDRLRVECNFGSKYFDDAGKAQAYFKGKVAEEKDVELWLVRYTVTRKGMVVEQKMIDCYTTFEPVFFDD